jgi:hypothetical protein
MQSELCGYNQYNPWRRQFAKLFPEQLTGDKIVEHQHFEYTPLLARRN